MIIRISLTMAALLLLGVLGGCGNDSTLNDDNGDGGGEQSNIPTELVAAWTVQSAAINSRSISLGQLFSWGAETVVCRITVHDDESYLYEELESSGAVGWSESGYFKVEENRYTMDTGHPLLQSGTWEVTDNELVLTTTSQGGHTLKVFATN
ncbi:MAG: hypothetical protein KAW46_06885 [candidate division Zixibacteria bacterium]|nr:hypothetical protein [candidate division Zixibacteria bacterium]